MSDNPQNLPATIEPSAPDAAESGGFDVATASPADFTAELHARHDAGDRAGAQRLLEARNTHNTLEAEREHLPESRYVNGGELDTAAVWEVFDAIDPAYGDIILDMGLEDGRGLAGVIRDSYLYTEELSRKHPNTYDACRQIGCTEEVARRCAAAYPRTKDGLEATNIEGIAPFSLTDHPAIIASGARYWRRAVEAGVVKADNASPTTTTTQEHKAMAEPDLNKEHSRLTRELMDARDAGDHRRAKELQAERDQLNEQFGEPRPIVGRGGRTA